MFNEENFQTCCLFQQFHKEEDAVLESVLRFDNLFDDRLSVEDIILILSIGIV